eukprot:6139576-Pyramimonas_sp.AAC.1
MFTTRLSIGSIKHEYCVTGDDMSTVKLFNYPVVHDDAPWKEYHGGASFITCVRFSCDDRRVVAVGGNDHTTFQYITHGINADELKAPREVDWCAKRAWLAFVFEQLFDMF